MTMSLRKSCSEDSAPSPPWKSQTLLAHCSKSLSWVTPRSSVIASYSVRPGDFRLLLGSPPSRCLTTSVVRFSALTLLTPATYFPSHLTRNLKFLYGSKRVGLTVNSAMASLRSARLSGELLQLDEHELGRLERGEADEDVHDSAVDVALHGRGVVALDEVRLGRGRAGEGALPEQRLHEGGHVQAELGPERFVVRLENRPLGAAEQALLDHQRKPAHGDVLPLARRGVRSVESARPPGDAAVDGERAQAVEPERVEDPVLVVGQLHLEPADRPKRLGGPGRRLPDAALAVRAREHSAHDAGGGEQTRLEVVEWVGRSDAREVRDGVRPFRGQSAGDPVDGGGERTHRRRRVDQQHRAA